jgi:hypothetical protein
MGLYAEGPSGLGKAVTGITVPRTLRVATRGKLSLAMVQCLGVVERLEAKACQHSPGLHQTSIFPFSYSTYVFEVRMRGVFVGYGVR